MRSDSKASSTSLSPELQETLEFVTEHIRDYGWAPTLREIVDGTSAKSTSTANARLRRLEALGYVAIGRDQSRAIRLARKKGEA